MGTIKHVPGPGVSYLVDERDADGYGFTIRKGYKYWIVTVTTPFVHWEDRCGFDCELDKLRQRVRAEAFAAIAAHKDILRKGTGEAKNG